MTKQATQAIDATQSALATMREAGSAAINGKAMTEQGKAKGADALATMVIGFSSEALAAYVWAFDIKGKDDAIHTYVECTGVNEFGNDALAWKRNADGKPSRDAQTAFKVALQNTYFGQVAPALWTMASKAIPMATAIRAEGMQASIVDGKLTLAGGTTEKAEAMRNAPSLSALAKVASDATGSNRAKPQNDKGDEEVREATPSEVLQLALRLVEGVAKGEEALANSALSFARRIAELVASNPDAFADV